MKKEITPFKSIDGKTGGLPEVFDQWGTLVKPGELVELIEVTPLGLTDLRIYNQLLANAWDNIHAQKIHKIAKAHLRGSHKGNERIEDTIERLMGAIATIKVTKDGEPSEFRVQLLGANVKQQREDGFFYYSYPSELLAVIKESTVFARLKSRIMYALRSKYALRLYELLQKRVNLSYKQYEEFSVDEFRQLLGVPKGKLTRFANFNTHAIKPAVSEVNHVSDHIVVIHQMKAGRKVEKLRMMWLAKTGESPVQTLNELSRHRAGRKTRMIEYNEALQ